MDRKQDNRMDHMANERTFLAWIRTSIGIMAFGFVVERFSLFMKQINFFVRKDALQGAHFPNHHAYSAILGDLLLGVGVLIGAFSFINYRRIEKQIDNDTYQSHHGLTTLLAASVTFTGILLIIYLSL